MIETSTLDYLHVQYCDWTDKFTQFFWSMCREIHSVVHLLKPISCSNEWYLGSVENISQTIADKCSLDIDYLLALCSADFLKKSVNVEMISVDVKMYYICF